MNKKRLRHVIYGFLGVLAILFGAALVLPLFFTLNDYKPQIAAKATEALGRTVSIDGNISLSLLPTPQLSVKGIRVANLEGGSPQDLLRLKTLAVSVNLFPLLRKRLEIKTIDLDQPEVFLEKLSDGRVNWALPLGATPPGPASSSSPSPTPPVQLMIDKALIHKGRVVYHEKGKDTEIHHIDASGKLGSLQGPYEISGTLQAMGQQVNVKANLGALGDNQDLSLSIHGEGATAEVNGKMSLSSGEFQGKLTASGDPKILVPTGKPQKLPPLLSKPLSGEAVIKANAKTLSLSRVRLDVGGAHPTGNLDISLQGPLKLQGNLKDFPGQGQCAFTLSSSARGIAGSLTASAAQAQKLFEWVGIETAALPPAARGPFTVSTACVFGDDIHLKNLNLTVQSAKLQGNVLWQPQKGSPLLAVDLETPKIEAILKLLGVKDPKPLGVGKFKGDIQWTETSLHLGHLKGQLGRNLGFAGDVAVNQAGPKPTVKATLSFNTLSLDTLLASRKARGAFSPDGQVFLIAAKPHPARSPWSHNPVDLSFLTKIDGQFDISASRFQYKDIVVNHPKLVAKLHNGRMDLKALTGSVFDGSLIGNGYLTADNTLRLHLALKEANLKSLVPQGGSIKLVGGKAFFTSDLSTHGNTLYAMVQNLAGPVNISAKEGVINGFDLHAVSQQLGGLKDPRSLLGLLTTSMKKGQTRFSSFNGDILFHNGVGAIQAMNLIAPDGQGQASGHIDLPRYLLDIHAEFRLTGHPKLPPFQMHLAGPLDNPSRELDTGALQTYMLENVFKGTLEKLGKGKLNGGNILNSLLGNGQENSPPPGEQPKKEDNSLKKPEKIVKDIFKGIF